MRKEYSENLKLHAGDDEQLAVRIRDSGGEYYDLTGCSGTLKLKKTYRDATALLTKSATFDKWDTTGTYNDTCIISFSDNDTTSLIDYTAIDELGDVKPVYGVFDLKIVDEDGDTVQIVYGSWVAVAEVTR